MVTFQVEILTIAWIALGFITSCNRMSKNDQPERQPTSMSSSLSSKVTLTVRNEELLVDYEISNSGDRDVYVLNRIYKTTPEWSINSDLIYIRMDHDTKTIFLSKKIPDLPPGVTVNSPVSPYVTPVRAGSTFR